MAASSNKALSMDVTAKSLDLGRIALELFGKSESSMNPIRHILQWLARECIDDGEFKYCIDLARGIAYPNDQGLQIQTSLAESEKRYHRIAGLNLIQSGAIGRWMAFDPDYCYMVTTVAALMVYHGHQFAADVLAQIIVDDPKTGSRHREQPYNVKRSRIKPVLIKIVESIALNVVNCGHGLRSLPEEFADLCTHILPVPLFTRVVIAIKNAQRNTLLYCTHFPADILVWLMTHFDGIIEVSVAGKVLFDKTFGDSSIKVTVLVHNTCDLSSGTHSSSHLAIEVSECFEDGQIKTILEDGKIQHRVGPRPTARQELYSIEEPTRGKSPKYLTHSEKNDVRLVAQTIAEWLLHYPLDTTIENNDAELYFRKALDEKESSKGLEIGTLLQRWPMIMNMQLGHTRKPLCLFNAPEDLDTERDLSYDNSAEQEGGWMDGDPVVRPSKKSISEIIQCFPIAVDFFENIAKRCRCPYCKTPAVKLGQAKIGCLTDIALACLLSLLAHTVADGFGAPDASGLVSFEDRKAAFQRLFTDLIWGRIVDWNTWFAFAATTFLGHPLIDDNINKNADEGATLIVVLQYGSMVAAATWIDLSQEHSVSRCFGFYVAEGRVQGLASESAIVRTEQTMDVKPCPKIESSTLKANTIDPCNIHLETAIIGTGPAWYRLLTMVRSDTVRRIIDPFDVLKHRIRSDTLTCCHDKRENSVEYHTDILYTFDEFLGRMPLGDINKDHIVVTTLLDSIAKFNVAIGVSAGSIGICIPVQTSRCCLACAKKQFAISARQSRMVIIRRSDTSIIMQYAQRDRQ